jgi:hypothetical protein
MFFECGILTTVGKGAFRGSGLCEVCNGEFQDFHAAVWPQLLRRVQGNRPKEIKQRCTDCERTVKIEDAPRRALLWVADLPLPQDATSILLSVVSALPPAGLLGLKSLNFSGCSLTKLPAEAFFRSETLARVTLGGLLREVGDFCFFGCDLLEDVKTEAQCWICSLGEGAFSCCPSLRCLPNLPLLKVVGPGCFSVTGVTDLNFGIYAMLREHGLGRSDQMAAESLRLPPRLRQPIALLAANLRSIEWAMPVLSFGYSATVERAVFTGFEFTCDDHTTIRSMSHAQMRSERTALFGRVTIPATPDGIEW